MENNNNTEYLDAAKDLFMSSVSKIGEVTKKNYEIIKSPEFQENAKSKINSAFEKTKEITYSTYDGIKNSETTKKITDKISEIKNSETSQNIGNKISETANTIGHKIMDTTENIKENENFKMAYNSIVSSGRKILDMSKIMIYGEEANDENDNLFKEEEKEDDPFNEKNEEDEENKDDKKDKKDKEGEEGEEEVKEGDVFEDKNTVKNEVVFGGEDDDGFGKEFTI